MTDPARLAREQFGIDAVATALPGEHVLNFRLDAGEDRYVLKLQPPQPLEDAVLEHLREVPGVPRLVDRGGGARLLSWLDGRPWADGGGDLESLGRTVARVDRALAGFTHPDVRRDHPWELNHARDFGIAVPALDHLPHQLIHNDANEHNVLVGADGHVTGLIDFGDVVWSARVCGLAVAGAYAMSSPPAQPDPARAVVALVRGYHEVTPLLAEELAVLFDLMVVRLRLSLAMSAAQHAAAPHNDYLLISRDGVSDALKRLEGADPQLAHFRFRDGCGYEPSPRARRVRQLLALATPVPVMQGDLAHATVLDLTTEIPPIDGLAIGRYDEERAIYTAPEFQVPDGRWRTRHMAVDVFAPAGTPVFAPLDGRVAVRENRDRRGDYGGLLVLDHGEFWTLHGHLDPATLASGEVRAGDEIARLGAPEVNGGWEPHLHFQIFTDLIDDLPGVALSDEGDVWRSVCPDPNLLLGLPGGVAARPARTDIAAKRGVVMSRALSLAYDEPLHIVRGEGAHLYDAGGRAYLDLVNNVAHVGHCHPRVVAAGARQMATLNTNTRYLHQSVIDYARRLAGTLPDPLHVCFFVNSGSEANDLALRLAAAHTGRDQALVLEHAYHGHLRSTIDLSPYKFGANRPASTRVVAPDAFEVDAPAAFFAESIQGCAGQVVLPPGFLAESFAAVRDAGGVCVADEVQVGFGRIGEHFWGFELDGVVPDIVTLGKPIGNGHPLGAVVTTPEIAASFVTGMEYFNTFGGNPVSAEIGLAVLDVIADERLQAHALAAGSRLLDGLRGLDVVDARGVGLFLGVELESAARARAVKEALKARGILISTDGPLDNVLKIKPPLVIGAEDCDRFLNALSDVL